MLPEEERLESPRGSGVIVFVSVALVLVLILLGYILLKVTLPNLNIDFNLPSVETPALPVKNN